MLFSQAVKSAMLPVVLTGLALGAVHATAPDDPLPPQGAGYEIWWQEGSEESMELVGLGDLLTVTNHGPGDLLVEYRALDGTSLGRDLIREGETVSEDVSDDIVAGKVGSGDETSDVDAICISDCLPLGTLVHTAAGHLRVEAVAQSAVRSLASRNASDPAELARVKRATSSHLVSLTLEGEALQVTRGHEFLTPAGRWVEACDLADGGQVMVRSVGSLAARAVTVESVERIELAVPVEVYDVVLTSPGDVLIGAVGAITRATVEPQRSRVSVGVLAR